ncbi:MAG: DNA polymerase III [Treponema sp.]|jgi:DNA polymerase-3 subunit gamma/tau|nr:DNA polymerase III [Treponema sp.]
MFETIVGQSAVTQLARDKANRRLAPSLLFSGPPSSGKGSAALELARVLACEQPDAPADCACASCFRHSLLVDPDTLSLGSRLFYAEICAAAAVFQRGEKAGRHLFIRSVKKLLARFSPVLWEDDPKLGKLSAYLSALEEDLDALDPAVKQKQVDALLKNALKLESEGMSDLIPIAQIRRAAYWSHLAPTSGTRKFLVLENADRMQDGARNALLKLLEEPPASITIVLTTAREGTLLPTILSRVRPYRFLQRPSGDEAEVIRRVFHDESDKGIAAYLDSFLPVSVAKLRPLAAFLAASIATKTVYLLRQAGQPLPEELVALGKSAMQASEAAGLGRPATDSKAVIAKVLADAGNFELRSLFQPFLSGLLALLAADDADSPNLGRDVWRTYTGEAANAVGTYNQSPALALERLMTALPAELAYRYGGLE